MTICDNDLAWIKANLDVLHTQLTEAEIQRWTRLMEEEPDKFYSLATMGFALRRSRDRQQVRIDGAEMGEFCGEFMVKISWAGKGLMVKNGMPLFEIVGDPIFAAACNHLRSLSHDRPPTPTVLPEAEEIFLMSIDTPRMEGTLKSKPQ